jgi:aquaporin Z
VIENMGDFRALVRRRITVRDASMYWIVQLAAGLLAAAVVRGIVDPARATKTVTMTLTGHGLVAAIRGGALLFTFALCYVVYLVAQVIAGAAAGVTFLALNPDDK